MEKHGCCFSTSAVTEIAMQISLRADLCQVEPFARRLVAKALGQVSRNEQDFLARHLVFALAERKAAVDESLAKSEPFSERGLQMDWDSSTAQEFRLYNSG